MIIHSKGIKTNTYFIPPFELREGELLIIYLYGGAHYHGIKTELVKIFTGRTKNDNVTIFGPLCFVEHITEPAWRQLFYPLTVGEYLKKKADLKSSFTKKVFDIDGISEKTRINTLGWNRKKLLSLYSTLSKTRDIVFDLVGQDPKGANETYTVVKDLVKNGGSAILIDWTDDLKNDCTKFITIEWLK